MQSLYVSLLAAVAGTTSAQYVLNNTIGSCADVHCPTVNGGTTQAECQVANRSHLTIGMRTIPSRITEDDADLTWTVGTQVYDITEDDERVRKVESDFYLGTPPGLNLSSDDLPYSGCAIFFYGNELLKEEEDNARTCEDIIGSECLKNIQNSARLLFQTLSTSNTSWSPDEVCERTRDGLNVTFPDGCDAVSGQNSWNRSEAVLLTGPEAPKSPSHAANQSSNCHPTLPKSNDLTHVFGYNETGTIHFNSTYPMLNAINLVLTTFWSRNGSVEGSLDMPDPQLTCLWPVDMNDRQLETMQPSSADRIGIFSWTARVLASVVCMAFMM